jgi:DNA-binding CsgD family transcriptional regulator
MIAGDDRSRALQVLDEAFLLAKECGMRPLAELCEHDLAALGERRDRVEGPTLPDGLTPREAEIIELLGRGLTNAEIGERLFISPRTVANHVQSILAKTGSGNRAEAAAYALRNGLAT